MWYKIVKKNSQSQNNINMWDTWDVVKIVKKNFQPQNNINMWDTWDVVWCSEEQLPQ